MTSLDTTADRFERGLAVLDEISGPGGRAVVDRLADIAPDLGRYVVEFGYGDIYSRPGLTIQQRQLVTIAALAALGTAAPQLRFHIDAARNVGVTQTEIAEALIQIAAYAGFPASINGVAALREVLDQRAAE
ncbi:carboxymuconolactone decarboxylase family protein [Nocardia seriolae]|uniref:Carboxymuconolactone decarboxylase n=1 Tax=Nocardia seriolae TaxID=37332 RepID=A0A0B8N161_9NOCA|nr:carboxymuconolactone decarboxylase family protein [Nocardia seriolae]MTJ62327.1 carboxymuconolactone decarboxylase family protein [Nocardia seriolae]MTJ70750.1 carboxymuconolactone decarboxylase family protein [Nocardia seriolae]MTJ87233.1 carboxymuconolactone decarboxylase family protein [Nocardia seriolae]MTK31227.1 carboxymuconolactone decarboxylase family protein [Nocardia seriolae]MTK40277.1 carboxymuconolactone decarboxylase family protein [Nocardia seriolae]